MSEIVLDDGEARLVLSVWDDAPPGNPEYHVDYSVRVEFAVCGLMGAFNTILADVENAVSALRALEAQGSVSVASLGVNPELDMSLKLEDQGRLIANVTIAPGLKYRLGFKITLDQSYLRDIADGLRNLRQ